MFVSVLELSEILTCILEWCKFYLLLQKNKEYVSIASGGFMGKILIY
jgi:hypothetical protein